ncbi:MAG TPA: ABC transporter permease [Anaerolineaceae bacterium]|nr:ABC transporter permease [Chloroflexota bacterium]HNY83422.1 ABC transporter permease [Anaerolineaceae bacterium]
MAEQVIFDKKPGAWRTFCVSTWLGWQIESNWTDLFVFLIYSIVWPLSRAAILVVMYLVIRGADFSNPEFVNMYLGNALFGLIGNVVNSVAGGIIEEREHYRTLKYLYVAPIHIPTYLVGRGVAAMAGGLLSLVTTVAFAAVFLHMPINFGQINWLLLIPAMLFGFIALVSIGLFLAGWALTIKNNPWVLGQSFSSLFFFVSGAVFPLSVVFGNWEWPGYIFPVGFWLVLTRRAIVPGVGHSFQMYTQLSDLQLLGLLALYSVVFLGIATLTFRMFDRKAREEGMIDMVSNY